MFRFPHIPDNIGFDQNVHHPSFRISGFIDTQVSYCPKNHSLVNLDYIGWVLNDPFLNVLPIWRDLIFPSFYPIFEA